MIFNSLTFLVFLIITLFVFWFSKNSIKAYVLILLSICFYGFWRWEYIILIFISAITDYVISNQIYKSNNFKVKKKLIITSILINLGLLFYFKYLYFFLENINGLLNYFETDFNFEILKIILPFGISFYTFETISYTVDVYRGIIKPEKKFHKYLLFVTFFPKLVAGPIQRANELIPQFINWKKFHYSYFVEGFERILFGLFLKVVLADNISILVDEMWSENLSILSGVDVCTMAFLFGFQIYFDFSAYSHIALGTAKMLGIMIPENFNFPYVANSFKEFWKRWHISLSAWIRDYLYLPLSGVKVQKSSGSEGIGKVIYNNKNKRKNYALFMTWTIMGFWHGANWTFILWGLYHAICIFLERKLSFVRSKIKILNSFYLTWPLTFFVSMLSWIPFRSNSVQDSLLLYSHLFEFNNFFKISFRENYYLIAFSLTLIFSINYFFYKNIQNKLAVNLYYGMYFIRMIFLIFMIFIFFKQISQFIYFQF